MALRYFQAQYEIGGAFYGITLNGKYKRNNSTVIARRKSNGIHTNVYSAEIVLFKSERGKITERIIGKIIVEGGELSDSGKLRKKLENFLKDAREH